MAWKMKLFTCHFFAIFNTHKYMHTPDIIHLNSLVAYNYWCCQCNHIFYCIRIYSSLLYVFSSVRRHLHPSSIPFHLFLFHWRIEKNRKKNLSNFLFEFLWAYQSMNLWIFELIIHTSVFNMHKDINTYFKET